MHRVRDALVSANSTRARAGRRWIPALRASLTAEFAPQVAELGELIGRDLLAGAGWTCRLASREIRFPGDSVTVHDVTFDEAVDLVIAWARDGSGGYVSTPNVDHLVRARRDPLPASCSWMPGSALPDGMGLIYGCALTGTRSAARSRGACCPRRSSARRSRTCPRWR